jgi:tetratricopeptide (TPR) repeat protein
MALENIERLKEQVEKDPESKLFIPLAEEYRKAEMLEEAIQVLKDGIERQPQYMSARVSLGKIYLDLGLLDDAKAEFEKVVQTIPENLFAHRKLAEIHRILGDRGKATEEYRTVLQLNPMDEWALQNLADIEKELQDSPRISGDLRRESDEFSEETISTQETISQTPGSTFMDEEFKSDKDSKESFSHSVPTIDDADTLISQGNYVDAMKIYKKIISVDPMNIQVKQRMEELKALLKVTGKDREILIERLSLFLSSIQKRRQEVFGG